jgi:hypothetical protein
MTKEQAEAEKRDMYWLVAFTWNYTARTSSTGMDYNTRCERRSRE